MLEMLYDEIQDAVDRKVPFIIPIGTLEYHARHASCGTDTLVITGCLRELEKEKDMTPFERQKDYVRRTILLKDFAKEIKTTNIFTVIDKRFRSAIKKNIEVIKKYGWKIALLECISDYFAEIIPVTGGFLYGCYRLIVAGNLPVSEFSVLISAITTCRNKLNHLAHYFAMQQKHCLWVQNLRDFLVYEPKIQGGTVIPGDFESLEFRNVSFRYQPVNEEKKKSKGLEYFPNQSYN